MLNKRTAPVIAFQCSMEGSIIIQIIMCSKGVELNVSFVCAGPPHLGSGQKEKHALRLLSTCCSPAAFALLRIPCHYECIVHSPGMQMWSIQRSEIIIIFVNYILRVGWLGACICVGVFEDCMAGV